MRPLTSDRVPLNQKLAYGLGGPVDILAIWVFVSIAYPVFNMELQMSPTRVAVILMALRLWDGIADPVMGWISDNTRSRWGRRRSLIFIGAILADYLPFNLVVPYGPFARPVDDLGDWFWHIILYLFHDLGCSCFKVC